MRFELRVTAKKFQSFLKTKTTPTQNKCMFLKNDKLNISQEAGI